MGKGEEEEYLTIKSAVTPFLVSVVVPGNGAPQMRVMRNARPVVVTAIPEREVATSPATIPSVGGN